MDVLVIVGDASPPERLIARAHHVVRANAITPDVVADLRARIPRDVGVIGAGDAATALHRAGIPVTFYSDEPATLEGIPVRSIAPRFADMEMAGSLLDLIGDTPLIELSRWEPQPARARIFAKSELANPGGSV
ncbi:MAG: hypothetical protein ABR552_10660, partial [Actinomycetota bacterium]